MKNYQKTSWQLSQSLVPDIMEEEDTKIYKYSRKLRFYPTREQKKLLESCFGATRYLCNKIIEGINNKDITKFSFISLRKKVMLSDKELVLPENEKERWLKDVPFDTRQLAIKRLSTDIKINVQKVKKNQIDKFQLKFKSKRNSNQYCFVDKRALKPLSLQIFPRRTKEPFKLRPRMGRW